MRLFDSSISLFTSLSFIPKSSVCGTFKSFVLVPQYIVDTMDSSTSNSPQIYSNSWKLFSISIGVGLLIGWKLRRFVSKPNSSSIVSSTRSSFIGLFNHKLVLIVPGDLATNRGNLARHCASASILAFRTSLKQTPWSCFLWSLTGQRKVVLRVNNSTDFEEICHKASNSRVTTSLIQEQSTNNSNNAAVLAVGPGSNSVLDQITGHLKLL